MRFLVLIFLLIFYSFQSNAFEPIESNINSDNYVQSNVVLILDGEASNDYRIETEDGIIIDPYVQDIGNLCLDSVLFKIPEDYIIMNVRYKWRRFKIPIHKNMLMRNTCIVYVYTEDYCCFKKKIGKVHKSRDDEFVYAVQIKKSNLCTVLEIHRIKKRKNEYGTK